MLTLAHDVFKSFSMYICRQFGGKMNIVSFASLLAVYFFDFALPSQGRFVKRIAQGDPLCSLDDYSTHHFVHLRHAWQCNSDQAVHDVASCEDKGFCGGTLFHPEFVITAAHCVSYQEFYLRESLGIEDTITPSTLLGNVERTINGRGVFGFPDIGANVVGNLAQRKHEFFSNVLLMAGSVDYTAMTQKRHADKIFQHPTFAGREGKFSLTDHDVAIIQACQPFDITPTVRTAPMLPLDELTLQYESIVKRSTSCLYVGFGDTHDPTTRYTLPRTFDIIQTRYLRYTWRQVSCSARCNFKKSLGWDQQRNPCILCSDHIPPRVGTPRHGDSGGPVVCDGFYVGPFTASFYEPSSNESSGYSYPLHCIRHALTPEALEAYRQTAAGNRQRHTLGPISLGRFHNSP